MISGSQGYWGHEILEMFVYLGYWDRGDIGVVGIDVGMFGY